MDTEEDDRDKETKFAKSMNWDDQECLFSMMDGRKVVEEEPTPHW
jgi:hypothetical protein